ncbi:Hypothetical protein R9X50_00056900 [Acrodontium crateriforme]|uniref:CREG-like beta-barrel domain-containing protein n=1 Tax=Acrodontium crateriforme TaxID=150365 RepID=A0AAQ3LXR7_9PEZI|nr:Hypothetical protein R9X50_00056900 [Acrodontium crateriforme]
MRLPLPVASVLGIATARIIESQEPLQPETAWHYPTVHESAIQARRILHLSTVGTLVTSFPNISSHNVYDEKPSNFGTMEARPGDVAGSPIGLLEYYADCEPYTGNPTILAINIATPIKNHAAGSPISLHVRWWPTQKNTYLPSGYDAVGIPTPHTPAALPRFSLHGHLEPISTVDLAKGLIPACFMHAHPDSAIWQPGSDVHESHYVRFVVEHVYWFGGFGDRARIGWLPIDEWRNVTMDEVAACRLPGEEIKGRKTWMEWFGLKRDL